MTEKRCSMCKALKPIDQFSWRRKAEGKRQPRCKPCSSRVTQKWYTENRQRALDYASKRYHTNPELNNRKQIARIHGLTLDEYDTLYAAGCAICGTHEPSTKRRMHVDHCHETGKVRGVLCPLCNVGLGHFRDDPTLLTSAAAYLRRTM